MKRNLVASFKKHEAFEGISDESSVIACGKSDTCLHSFFYLYLSTTCETPTGEALLLALVAFGMAKQSVIGHTGSNRAEIRMNNVKEKGTLRA